jgi:alkylation response protein AidB-like acyl-CoA dehydrogenase
MNLTEPHCGTDLGLMRTKAEPQADGSYKITGQKIFISAGEHDMAENIVHLVLAKIPGGPEGIKGVSLFIVPKFLVNEDGSLGARNGVSCGKIEEKMGIHGNSTCVMNYDGADRLPAGRGAQGHARHVHHDERGPARRRHAGRGAGRGRVPERARIRQGPPAGPRRDRRRRTPTARPIR